MLPFIEEFKIFGQHYAIEDYEDGRPDAEYFFPDHYRAEKKQGRYQIWIDGSGVGSFKTLDAARCKIVEYARDYARRQAREAEATLRIANFVLTHLYNDTAYLFRFEKNHKGVNAP